MEIWIAILIIALILSAIKMPKSTGKSPVDKKEPPHLIERRLRKAARKSQSKKHTKTLPWFDSSQFSKNKKSYWD